MSVRTGCESLVSFRTIRGSLSTLWSMQSLCQFKDITVDYQEDSF